jgi:hypothetical protein
MNTIRNFLSIIISLFLVVGVIPAMVNAQGSLERRSDDGGSSTKVDRDQDDDMYDNGDVRRLVEQSFGDDHVMVDVARCESSFRQFASDGDVLVNSIGATGVFQILQRVHEDIAEDFGYDIYTLGGNIGYAKALYEADGLKPWSASSLCWDDGNIEGANPEVPDENSSSGMLRRRVEKRRADLGLDDKDQVDTDRFPEVISKRLIIGVEDEEVLVLQELLNRLGYELAGSGPGSAGEETSFFGSLTKQALQEFQCDQEIVCSGSEYTTGFGMTEERTRAALNKVAATGITSGRVRQRDEVTSTSKTTTEELQEQIRALMVEVARLEALLGR